MDKLDAEAIKKRIEVVEGLLCIAKAMLDKRNPREAFIYASRASTHCLRAMDDLVDEVRWDESSNGIKG